MCNRSLGVRNSHTPDDQSFPFFQSVQVPTCSSKVSHSEIPASCRFCFVLVAAEIVGSQQAESYRARLCMAVALLQWLHTVCGAACWHKHQLAAESIKQGTVLKSGQIQKCRLTCALVSSPELPGRTRILLKR